MASVSSVIPLEFPVGNLLRKWGPGKDPKVDPPDEVLGWEGPEPVGGEVAQQFRAYERLWNRAKWFALSVAVGAAIGAAAMGWIDRASTPAMGGGLATIGAEVIASRLIGEATYTAYNSANGYLGVGDSSTAFAVGQTDLQASSNKARVVMDGGYPSRATNVVTFKATFNGSTANFAWLENGVFNHASAGQMLVRKVVNLGTKASGSTWEFSKTVTITAA